MPDRVKTLILLIEDSTRITDKEIARGGWKAQQLGRLRDLDSVKRLTDAEVIGDQSARKIRLIYFSKTETNEKGPAVKMPAELASGEIEDIATLALLAKQVTIMGVNRKDDVVQVLRNAVVHQIMVMGLGEKCNAEAVVGRVTFRDDQFGRSRYIDW
jgi:hypothetical protein